MKKPLPIKFVAAWCFLALFLTLGGTQRSLKTRLPEGDSLERLFSAAIGFAVILSVWHSVRLVQLKTFNRWFTVVFFGWWTFTLTWNGFAVYRQFEQPRVLIVFIVPIVLNLTCIYYLTRRKFREFAVQYVGDHEQEDRSRAMQKAAQKRMEKEIRSLRR